MPRVLLLGSPPFAEPTRRVLAQRGWLAGVLTRPAKPRGRGLRVPVLPYWRPPGDDLVPVGAPATLEPESSRAFLRRVNPDAVVLASFGLILPDWFLALLPRLRLNVHPSLLPRWRGPAPIPRSILAGDTDTGVTLHELTSLVDAGPIVATRRLRLRGTESTGGLTSTLGEVGAALLAETLPRLVAGGANPHPQDDRGATEARKVKPDEGPADWRKSALELERAARAFDPWPHLTTQVGGATLILHRLAVWPELRLPVGTLQAENGVPVVGTGRGAVELIRVQRPGGRAVPGRAFLAGLRLDLPATLPSPAEPLRSR